MTTTAAVATPDQKTFARKFWTDFASGDLVAYFFLGRTARLRKTFGAARQAEMMSKLDELLIGLGYSTSMAVVLDEREASRGELGFWQGRYVVYDQNGGRYELDVTDGVLLVGEGGRWSDASFEDGTLSIGDDHRDFELTFDLPTHSAAIETDPAAIERMLRDSQARCRGRVTIVEGETETTLTLEGKRGCYTRAGVDRTEDGDAPELWSGVYSIVHRNDEDVFQMTDDRIVVAQNAGATTVRYAGSEVGDVVYGNNGVAFGISGGTDRFAGRFVLDADGNKHLEGMIRAEDGSTRAIVAFWIGAGQDVEAAPAPARFHGVATNRLGDVAPSALLGDSEAIEVQLDVDKNDKVVPFDLPIGIERNPYRLHVTMKGMEISEGSICKWAFEGITPSDAPFPLDFVPDTDAVVSVTDSNGSATTKRYPRAYLDASWGETQHAQIYKFTIKVVATKESGAADGEKTMYVRLRVDSRANMTISPEELPPVISGQAYSVKLAASGGAEPYKWSRDSSDALPIPFDAATGTFSGKTSASQSVTPVVVTVHSGPSVVMAPTRVSYSLNVKEPEQVGGAQASWVLYALGILTPLAGFGYFAYKHIFAEGGPLDYFYENAVKKAVKSDYEVALKGEMKRSFEKKSRTGDAEARIDKVITDLKANCAAKDKARDDLKAQRDSLSKLDPKRKEIESKLEEAKRESRRAEERLESANTLKDRFAKEVRSIKKKKERLDKAHEFFA